MAPDDTDGRKPTAPAVLRIKLRYNSVEAMVNRFAPNVGNVGIFLPTRQIYPPGTEIKFELRLATDVPMLVGLGRVKSSHEPDPRNSRAVFGIAVEIIRVTREGRQLLVRLIERRRAMGLPDLAIPIPADIDAARRADIETQPRAQIPSPGVSLLGQHSTNVLTAPRAAPVPLTSSDGTTLGGASLALTPEPARPPRRRLADVIAAARPVAPQTEAEANFLDQQVDIEGALARARSLATGDLDGDLAGLRDSNAAPLAEVEVDEASAQLARHLGGIAVKRDRSAPVAAPVVAAADHHESSDPSHAKTPRVFPRGITVVEVAADDSRDDSKAEVATPESSAFAFAPASEPATLTAEPSAIPPEVAEPAGDVAVPAADVAVSSPLPGESETLPEPPSAGEVVATASALPPSSESETAAEEPAPFPEQENAAAAAPASAVASPAVSPPEEDDDPDLSSFERALDAARIQTGVTHTPAPPATSDEGPGGDGGDGEDSDVYELDDSEIRHLRVVTPPAGVAVSPDSIAYPDATAVPASPGWEGETPNPIVLAHAAAALPDAERVEAAPSPTMHPDATPIPQGTEWPEQTSSPSMAPDATPIPRNSEGEEVSDVDVLAEANEEDDDLLHAHLRRDELVQSAAPAPPSAPEFLDPAELIAPLVGVKPALGNPVTASASAAPYVEPSALRGGQYAQSDDHYEEAHYEEAHYEEAHYESAHDPSGHGPPLRAAVSRPYPNDFDNDFASRLDLDDDEMPEHIADADSYTFADRISAGRVASPPAGFDDPYGLEDALSNLDAEAIDPRSDRRRSSPSRRPPLPGMPAELRDDPFETAPAPRPKRFVTEDGVVIDFDDDES